MRRGTRGVVDRCPVLPLRQDCQTRPIQVLSRNAPHRLLSTGASTQPACFGLAHGPPFDHLQWFELVILQVRVSQCKI